MTALLTRPIEDATRREFLTLLATAGLVTGCATDSEQAQPPATTRRVVNEFGIFDVPLEPQRLICLDGRRDLETAIVLGLRPIAVGDLAVGGSGSTVDTGETAPWLTIDLTDVETVPTFDVNVEAVLALNPDLILVRPGGLVDEQLAELARFVPLVPVTDAADWRTDLRDLATTLGRERQATNAIAAHEERRNEIRARHADRISAATIAVVQFSDGQYYGIPSGEAALPTNTLLDLGGTPLPFVEDGGEAISNEGFSPELVGELTPADAIYLIQCNPQTELRQIEAQPLWRGCPAVRAGRVVVGDCRTFVGSVLAAGHCLGELDRLYGTLR